MRAQEGGVSGYVRIHRTLLGHPAFRNDAEAMAFAWMVAKAAWKTTKARYKGHDILLQRGQLTISIRDFADRHDRPKGWVERLFARLREHGMIEQKNGTEVGTKVGTHGGTGHGTPANVITICNYDVFQPLRQGSETPDETPSETDAGQQPDTEQRREEGKNKISSVAKATSPRPWALPVGVSLQVWTDFKKNRSRRRLPNTDTAWKAFLDDLARVSSQTGIPPPKLIEQCTAKGWGGIYDPNERSQRNERASNPTGDALARVQAAIRGGSAFR
jgi:hypothetical protein